MTIKLNKPNKIEFEYLWSLIKHDKLDELDDWSLHQLLEKQTMEDNELATILMLIKYCDQQQKEEAVGNLFVTLELLSRCFTSAQRSWLTQEVNKFKDECQCEITNFNCIDWLEV